MRSRFVLALAVFVGLAVIGCATAQPAPTQAPPAPTKAAEPAKPTAAPTAAAAATAASTKAAAPTAVPAPKVTYPEKGKSISFLVGFAAGGGADLSARILAEALEKQSGGTFTVVNKVGASSQVAMTDLSQAKPDGYTIGYASLPTSMMTYLDADRKATYNGKSFQTVANHGFDAAVVAVPTNSPYKTMKDLVDDAKARPEKVKIGTSGILSGPHLTGLLLGKATGAKFAFVHFDGTAPATVSMLGGNVDTVIDPPNTFLSQVKNNQIRILGVAADQETGFFPGVTTLKSQGYDVHFAIAKGVLVPAGTPKEIVNLLSDAIKKAIASDDTHKQKMQQLGSEARYMDPEQYATYWSQVESQMQPLVQLAKQ